MKTTLKTLLSLSLAVWTFTASATRNEMANVQPDDELRTNRRILAFNGLYKFRADATLKPSAEFFGGLRVVDPLGSSVTFSKNEPVAIEILNSGEVKLTLLVAQEERGKIPESMILSAQEFNNSGLQYIGQGGAKELAQKFSVYEDIQVAGRNRIKLPPRMHGRFNDGSGYYGCVGWVCNSIGGCSGTTGGGRGMTSYLRGRGWRSVSCKNPPIGAVASWSGGPHDSGHTGRWNGSGWCYDKGCGDPGAGYRMKDCVAR